jgi:sulfofructose kinase
MKILGIGESVIDKVRVIRNQEGESIGSFSAGTHVGGPVLSALILMSRLGLECTLLTSIGRDIEADVIRQKLADENIKVVENIQEKTKINTILIDAGSGQREKIRGKTKHSPIKDIPSEFIQLFDFIIIDRHEKEAFYEILSKKKPCTKIVIDPSTEISNFTLDMIRQSEYPILPIESLVKFGEGKDLRVCLELLYDLCNKPLTITVGELGSLVYDGRELNVIPALKVNAVDTTGAGDVFRGAFTYGLIKKWSLCECAKFANSVAALQCTKLGNAAAIPTKTEIGLITDLKAQRKQISLDELNSHYLQLNRAI